ncbi:MAG TPA: sigma-70 family RNA polymerase sigma factor [Thermoanaerobaculia bacterium]|jgi:RNA polymerase sigma-70 factor (ECF subfamily)
MTTIPLARPLAMDGEPHPAAEPPPAPDDEAGLLAALRAGRPRAAERLVEATYAKLWAACHRMTGDAEDAADLVQETYRKAWQSLAEFRGESRVSTWLFRIAWTTHAKRLRRPRLVVPLDPVREASEPAAEPSPETQAAASEQARRLRAAVATLPGELRFAVVARYWAEQPVREIAAAERVTPMAIRKRLARAFRLLAAQLDAPSEGRTR